MYPGFLPPKKLNSSMQQHFILTGTMLPWEGVQQVVHFGIYNQFSRDGILHFYKLTMNWNSTL